MLTMTESAATEIRNITALPEAPEGGGVRIATDVAEGSLTMTLAANPAEDDTVVDTDGARLFLDTGANTVLDDKTLDAVEDTSGQTQFAVIEQAV